MKVYIGIDPGMSGGIAVICSDGTYVDAMPETETDILEYFENLKIRHEQNNGELSAVIEDVGHGRPGENVAAMCKFARHCGVLEQTLRACRIPFIKVVPTKWMKTLGIGSSRAYPDKRAWKNKLKATAQERYPNIKVTLKTCDALLLADYCQKLNT